MERKNAIDKILNQKYEKSENTYEQYRVRDLDNEFHENPNSYFNSVKTLTNDLLENSIKGINKHLNTNFVRLKLGSAYNTPNPPIYFHKAAPFGFDDDDSYEKTSQEIFNEGQRPYHPCGLILTDEEIEELLERGFCFTIFKNYYSVINRGSKTDTQLNQFILRSLKKKNKSSYDLLIMYLRCKSLLENIIPIVNDNINYPLDNHIIIIIDNYLDILFNVCSAIYSYSIQVQNFSKLDISLKNKLKQFLDEISKYTSHLIYFSKLIIAYCIEIKFQVDNNVKCQ